MPLTKDLGQFVADLSPNRIPEAAVRVARMGIIDCIGTMIAGRKEDCVRIMREVLAPAGGPATITFGPDKGPAPEVAWINGTAAHALDYDDVGLRGHPSTVLVPAILAEAETLGSSGADIIVAYIAGYRRGRNCSAAIPACCTRKAGIPPACMVRSARLRPARRCAGWMPTRRPRRSRSAPRKAAD